MLHDYICGEDVRARANIYRYETILKGCPNDKVMLYGKEYDVSFLRERITELKEMPYCKECKHRRSCAEYQARKDKKRRKRNGIKV